MYFSMSTKKKKKKKNSRRSALVPVILILIVIMVALVAVWQLRGVIGSNATTARAVARTMGNSYSGTVVIARNERLYETENKTSIDFVAAEGSHVSRSGVICKVYSSGYNQTEINRLQTYRQEIQSYHVSTVFGSYVDAALDSENQEIANLAQQVRTLVQGRGVGSLSNLEKQLSSSLTVRKNYLKQKYPDDQTLSELYKVENDQLKKIESWTTTYTASEDCIVSFYTDGYENSVNSSTYGTLNPSDVRAVIRGAMPEHSERSSRMNGTPCSSVRIGIGTPLSAKPIRCSSQALMITSFRLRWFPSPESEAIFCCACTCRRASSPCSTSAHAALPSAIL